MNVERKIKWIESILTPVSHVLFFIHFRIIEKLFPLKQAELLDINDLSKEMKEEWQRIFKQNFIK